jgi:hypothetical protein
MVAGFPLASIQRALAYVGMLESMDDIKNVSEGLRCPPHQALRVLEELERRGYVTKLKKAKYWDLTERGRSLAYYWKPPRKLHPAIEREDSDIACMEAFGTVQCFILRPTSDDEDVFEDAVLDVGVNLQYDNERLIELNVVLPHDYEEPEGNATIESSAYVSVAEAKVLISGLQDSVTRAERELARRASKSEHGVKEALVPTGPKKPTAKKISGRRK